MNFREKGNEGFHHFGGGAAHRKDHQEGVVPGNGADDRNLLLIKDSYANTFIQFLLPYFDTIMIVDPRYYSDDIYSGMAVQAGYISLPGHLGNLEGLQVPGESGLGSDYAGFFQVNGQFFLAENRLRLQDIQDGLLPVFSVYLHIIRINIRFSANIRIFVKKVA